jgi:y4mF family transcriptional regulator
MASRTPKPRATRRVIPPDQEINVITRLVRDRRRAAGLTQRALSELAGVGPRAVWDLERGKATLRMDVVNRILAVFGKTLGAIDAARTEEPAP